MIAIPRVVPGRAFVGTFGQVWGTMRAEIVMQWRRRGLWVAFAGAFFLQAKLLLLPAAHPFIIPYTYWGEQDAPDWWTNRLTLSGIALGLAIWNGWLLRREERLLGQFH